MSHNPLDYVTIDSIIYTALNPVILWSSILVLLYTLPAFWGRCLALTSFTLTLALWLNKKYKRRGQWDQLGPNDVALITGGSNGLGLELVKRLLDMQVKVINIDIEPIPEELKDRVVYFKCDLSDATQVSSILHTIRARCSIPTVIINNAAVRHNERFENLGLEKINKIVQINTVTPMIIIKFFLKNYQRRLFVVNVSSILGLVSPSNLSIYSLSKSSIISLHDTLTHEFASNHNMRFLLVTPGQLNTRMFQDVKPPKAFFAPILNSVQLAQQIIQKVDCGERGVLNGPLYTYFIPLLRMLPFSVVEFARWFSEMDVSVTEDP